MILRGVVLVALAASASAFFCIARCPQCPRCPAPVCPKPQCPPPSCPAPPSARRPKCPRPECPRPHCPPPRCPSPVCPRPRGRPPICPRPKCPSPVCPAPVCPAPECPKCPACPGLPQSPVCPVPVAPACPPPSCSCPVCIQCSPPPVCPATNRNLPPGYAPVPSWGHFKIYWQKSTWDQANRICKVDGGHLAYINTPGELHHLLWKMNTHLVDVLHIGHLDSHISVPASGDMNQSVSSQKSRQPSDTEIKHETEENKPGQTCVSINRKGQILTDTCSNLEYFVCEI